MVKKFFESYGIAIICLFSAVALISISEFANADDQVSIDKAKWRASDSKLVITGENAGRHGDVEIYNAASNELLYSVRASRRGTFASRTYPTTVPCSVKVTSHGTSNEKDVDNAPEDCDNGEANTNQPPAASNDSAVTNQDTAITIDVAANDSDPDGRIDLSSIAITTDVSNGDTTKNDGGTVSYTPKAGFTGNDSFAYTVKDDKGASSNAATVTITVNTIISSSDSSINSTSQNGTPVMSVDTQPAPGEAGSGGSGHVVLAINDLGMHCGDLDTRISSILPPFNVIHATLIQKGSEPKILTGKDGVELSYSAAANPNDPALSGFGPSGVPLLSSRDIVSGKVYKTNFWDIALQAYEPFYPPGILNVFDPTNFKGLPVPDVESLYLGPDGIPGTGDEGPLAADQQIMPGHLTPYDINEPQKFKTFVENQPFFVNFPFGYTVPEVKWFEAAGIPLAAFDDFGLENPYPLMRVQAHGAGGQILATVDTVTPISGEANCQGCHAAIGDYGNGSAIRNLESTKVKASIEDPLYGSVPNAVSVEWASDLNILSLHDQKHSTSLNEGFDLDTGRANNPVVCQTCHYTPALDLAQVGPKGPTDADANGRQQTNVRSMSNVMHSHHAVVKDTDDTNGKLLFPDMPPPVDNNGNLRDAIAADDVLQKTCYQCHPGNRTNCLRGAMSNGGMICQDCHGDMAQVGDDFSRNVSPAKPGAFELAGDFYKPLSATPRVPWANEPGCGSCHTGDAIANKHGDTGTIGSPNDNIRLMQAYLTSDSKATPIVPDNKRFAENVVESGAAKGNPKLYRVSTGHEGVFCEACHGATHAIWPNANPNANDNVTAKQLQGHSGTITECSTCHTSNFDIDDFKGNLDGNGWMKGPHGMHPVGTAMWNDKHKEALQDAPAKICSSCHGADGLGTVLSRTATDRVFECKENGTLCGKDQKTVSIRKGTPIGCVECHENEIGGSGHDD